MHRTRFCKSALWRGIMVAAAALGPYLVEAAEDEDDPPFREELFLSELQREAGYAQAVRVGGVVFVSATTGPGDSLAEQLRAAYIRVQATLSHYGLRMEDVAHERIYTLDMEALQAAMDTRLLYYRGKALPAVSWVEVARLPEAGRLVAVELMAVAGEE